jgi:hypothetical protein
MSFIPEQAVKSKAAAAYNNSPALIRRAKIVKKVKRRKGKKVKKG